MAKDAQGRCARYCCRKLMVPANLPPGPHHQLCPDSSVFAPDKCFSARLLFVVSLMSSPKFMPDRSLGRSLRWLSHCHSIAKSLVPCSFPNSIQSPQPWGSVSTRLDGFTYLANIFLNVFSLAYCGCWNYFHLSSISVKDFYLDR